MILYLVVPALLLLVVGQVESLGQVASPVNQARTASLVPLRAEGYYFKDAQGRVVILRGVNMAGNSKVPPFTPITSAGLLDSLPAWGINAIRLLFTWEAFEPGRGRYNSAYLDYYEQVVQWAAQRDLYVIVDFHQDAYSRFALDGCGEGFPEWAVTPEVKHKRPDNGRDCRSWGVKMTFDRANKKIWQQFHSDKYGIRTSYLKMVDTVASRLARQPNIIGYELINEPWGTDEQLLRLFEMAGGAIRRHHPGAMLFVPAHALVSGGMAENHIGKPGFSNFVYSPHYYAPSVVLFNSWWGKTPARALDKLRTTANDWGVPMLLSEFGAGDETRNVKEYMEAQFDWLDRYGISSAQWNYTPGWNQESRDGWNMEDLSIVDDHGKPRRNFSPRPYPRKIAGTPGLFLRDERGISLSWNHDPQAGSTELYLPAHFAENKRCTLALPPGTQGDYNLTGHILTCTINAPGTVTFTVQEQ